MFHDNPAKIHDMLENAFYALVLDEIQMQPNLKNELGVDAFEAVFAMYLGFSKAFMTGSTFEYVRSLLPWPARFVPSPGEVLWMFKFSSNYDALCRSSLLHLFWGELEAAEKKVNAARKKHDERAFAHHVYGLLRGLQEDRDGARFELGLALERESFEGAKQRIRRGLQLCDAGPVAGTE